MEVSDRDDPVVQPEVWLTIVQRHVREAELGASIVKNTEHSSQADIRDQDKMSLFRAEKGRVGEEVAVAEESLGLRAIQATSGGSDVVEEINGPAQNLLHDNAHDDDQGSILAKILHLLDPLGRDIEIGGILLETWGDVVVVLLEVVGVDVVATVGGPPSKVGSHKCRVQSKAHNVVESVGLGPSSVATLMSVHLFWESEMLKSELECKSYPDASEDKTVDPSVECPGRKLQSGVRKKRNVLVCRIRKTETASDITEKVKE